MNSLKFQRKRLGALMMILGSLLCSDPALALNGRDVYDQVHALRVKAIDRKTEFTMILHDKDGATRTRSAVEYSKKTEGDAYKVLILFKTPPDLNDVGFLIHARNFADRDLWAYFPEFKRIRRIPTTSQDDSFFGTDFSYDDFGGPPNLDEYSFTILREEVQDARPCYVVEVQPKTHRKWTRYQAWVDKEQFVHRKIIFFQDKEAYRTGTFTDIRVVDGLPTAFHMEMTNLKSNHRTEVVIDTLLYHTSHPDELFTQRALERAGR